MRVYRRVFRAEIVSKLTYASPAWSGFASQLDINKIDRFLSKAKKPNFYPTEGPTQLWSNADDKLFQKIQDNPHHVLYKLLPMKSNTGYNLRTRKHPFCLPVKDNRNFINRVLYKGKGDALECGSYRGIKLLDQVMKVMERVIEKRIRSRVQLDEMQFGFRPGRGTTDAIFIVRQLQEEVPWKEERVVDGVP